MNLLAHGQQMIEPIPLLATFLAAGIAWLSDNLQRYKRGGE